MLSDRRGSKTPSHRQGRRIAGRGPQLVTTRLASRDSESAGLAGAIRRAWRTLSWGPLNPQPNSKSIRVDPTTPRPTPPSDGFARSGVRQHGGTMLGHEPGNTRLGSPRRRAGAGRGAAARLRRRSSRRRGPGIRVSDSDGSSVTGTADPRRGPLLHGLGPSGSFESAHGCPSRCTGPPGPRRAVLGPTRTGLSWRGPIGGRGRPGPPPGSGARAAGGDSPDKPQRASSSRPVRVTSSLAHAPVPTPAGQSRPACQPRPSLHAVTPRAANPRETAAAFVQPHPPPNPPDGSSCTGAEERASVAAATQCRPACTQKSPAVFLPGRRPCSQGRQGHLLP